MTMADWVILVDTPKDFPNADTPHKVITTKDYLARPGLFRGQRPKIVNLSRSFNYQTRGYYCSLLAEARGHRIIPSVETMVDLGARQLYAQALPELDDTLAKALAAAQNKDMPGRLLVYFGEVGDHRFDKFGRLLFDWFRCPVLEVTIETTDRPQIKRLAPVPVTKLTPAELNAFHEALHSHTSREWRDGKARTPARYTFATLVDPNEALAPSEISSLRYWAKIAEKMGVEVEPITKKDLAKLANYDALFIRETTSISNHTYRFARRAQQEGMPVIDDPLSMIRCTNKVYLNELMAYNKVPVPPTVMIASPADFELAADTLGFPLVLKIPDSSFSRGVKKVSSLDELKKLATTWLEDSDLLIAQKFLPTEYDWRVGVLGGQPLFAVHYLMVKKHWQIVNHDRAGKPLQGGIKTFTLKETPPLVVETAVKAARCIGDGLYGVDLKETKDGVFIIEVNDNPNLDHGWEDSGEKDEVWVRLTQWFLDRLEA
jgi:glutathione synthase/RimK-type ligase-like ATP-grasp enzyme